MEVPEDLDVCIAQRHFEEAYNLLKRAREFLDKNTHTDPVITDIRYASHSIFSLLPPPHLEPQILQIASEEML